MSLLALLLAAPSAFADLPRVVVASSPAAPPRPGLVEAVAIQLSGRARVEAGPELAGVTGEERRMRAMELAADRDAVLVAWIDENTEYPGAGPALHVLKPSRGREAGLVTVEEIPPGEGPEVERAIAIKVREVLDRPEKRTPEPAPPAEPPAPEPPPPAPPAAALPIAELQLGLLAAGGNVGIQGELAAAAGLASRSPLGRSELVLAFRLPTGTEVESFPGRVTTQELAGGLGLRHVVPFGESSIGAHTSLWVRRVVARGEAATGETGSVTRYVPGVRLGPEFRWHLHPQAALRAAAVADVSIRRQWFTIYGDRVSDLGRLRLGASVSLIAAWR